MVVFLKKHWLALGLVVFGLIVLAVDFRGVTVAGLSFGAALFSFISRLLSGGKGPIGQPDSDPARQVDDNLKVVQTAGIDAERTTDEALRIVEQVKAKDRK